MTWRRTACPWLQALPIDLRHEDHKEMLRKSGLGKNVMFLFKCPSEVPDNQRLAKVRASKGAGGRTRTARARGLL